MEYRKRELEQKASFFLQFFKHDNNRQFFCKLLVNIVLIFCSKQKIRNDDCWPKQSIGGTDSILLALSTDLNISFQPMKKS